MKTNITGAFKMRNLIKAEIADRTRRISATPFDTKEGDEPNLKLIKNEPYTEYLDKLLEAHNHLAELNAAIDVANVANRKAIHDLDSIKAQMSILKVFEDKAENFEPTVIRQRRAPTAINPYNTEEFVEKRNLNFNAEAVEATLKTLKAKRLELEEVITKNNAITDVELSDEFASWYTDFIA